MIGSSDGLRTRYATWLTSLAVELKEDRGQRTEQRGQRTGHRRHGTEDRAKRTEDNAHRRERRKKGQVMTTMTTFVMKATR